MGRITNKFIFLIIVAFGIWYLLRKTTLGSAFSNDMFEAGGFFSTNTREGLGSAKQYL